MLKFVVAGATALAIAGSTLAYAQQRPTTDNAQQATTAREGGSRWRPTAEDFSAFADARIAALKTGLKLTPDQEKNWPAVETAIRDLAKQRADRIAKRVAARKDGPRQFDPIERLRNRADAMTDTATGLKRLADASEPLYKTLDDGQKRRLVMLTRNVGGQRDGHHRGWRGHHKGGSQPL